MDGGDVYLHHKSLSNLLLLIKCILYLPAGAALSSNGSVGCSTDKSSPVAFGFGATLLLRRRGPFANGGPGRQHIKPSKIIVQIHSILQWRKKMKGENEILTDNFMAACSDSCPRDPDADWVLESKQLVCSSTESCLFSVVWPPVKLSLCFPSYIIFPNKQVFCSAHGSRCLNQTRWKSAAQRRPLTSLVS